MKKMLYFSLVAISSLYFNVSAKFTVKLINKVKEDSTLNFVFINKSEMKKLQKLQPKDNLEFTIKKESEIKSPTINFIDELEGFSKKPLREVATFDVFLGIGDSEYSFSLDFNYPILLMLKKVVEPHLPPLEKLEEMLEKNMEDVKLTRQFCDFSDFKSLKSDITLQFYFYKDKKDIKVSMKNLKEEDNQLMIKVFATIFDANAMLLKNKFTAKEIKTLKEISNFLVELRRELIILGAKYKNTLQGDFKILQSKVNNKIKAIKERLKKLVPQKEKDLMVRFKFLTEHGES